MQLLKICLPTQIDTVLLQLTIHMLQMHVSNTVYKASFMGLAFLFPLYLLAGKQQMLKLDNHLFKLLQLSLFYTFCNKLVSI